MDIADVQKCIQYVISLTSINHWSCTVVCAYPAGPAVPSRRCRWHVVAWLCACTGCECASGLCDAVSGQCVCPPRVTGPDCDVCLPQTFGFDPLIGCEDCACDPNGVVYNNHDCDINTGQCRSVLTSSETKMVAISLTMLLQ